MTRPIQHRDGDVGSIIIYRDEAEQIQVRVVLKNNTVWLTQKRMSELFGCTNASISQHLKSLYIEGELDENVTTAYFVVVQQEGPRTVHRTVKHYNLQAVMAVGFRIHSERAVEFRSWATRILREHIVKENADRDSVLKNPEPFLGQEYFDAMIGRIREIRLSNRSFYQKLTDIYAQCSVDYDKDSDTTFKLFTRLRDKLVGAVMRRAPDRTHDVEEMNDELVAQNYLHGLEREKLNRLADKYIDFAERQAEKMIAMTMLDWVARFEAILQFNESELIEDQNGRVTKAIEEAFSIELYQIFTAKRPGNQPSDYDTFSESETRRGLEKS